MQNTRLITFILRHYLKFDKTQPFISITAILAFLGVGVGVMVLLVTMSIMNGMIKEFEHKLFIMNYPITIFSTSNKGLSKELLEYLEEKFPKLKFSPYMQTQAVIRMNAEIYPLVVYAIDLEREREVNKVLYESRTKEFSNTFNLIMGETFYYSLGLHSDEKVTLIFTELAPTGIALTPKMKKFGIDGTFASGLRNYDNSIVYTTFEALQALRSGVGDETYEGFHIFSNEPMKDIESIRLAIDAYMQESGKIVHAEAQGWWEQNGNFFAAMELEKKALFLVLMLIILMASLNIISSLLMVVMNRRKEIALLISLGASKKHVKQIFFRLGVVIGGSGIIFGIIGSFIVMWILKTFDIISIPADVYGVSRLPIELLWTDLLWTVIGACIIVCLSSYYPAKKASQIDVLQVLRNE